MIHRTLIIDLTFLYRQGLGKLFLIFLIAGTICCSSKVNIEPPAKNPLSRSVLGYGVVNASYTRVMNEPGYDGVALGFIREKTIVTVLERRLVKEGDMKEYWVLIEGSYRGWLPESVIKLYDNEDKAQTAAR